MCINIIHNFVVLTLVCVCVCVCVCGCECVCDRYHPILTTNNNHERQ